MSNLIKFSIFLIIVVGFYFEATQSTKSPDLPVFHQKVFNNTINKHKKHHSHNNTYVEKQKKLSAFRNGNNTNEQPKVVNYKGKRKNYTLSKGDSISTNNRNIAWWELLIFIIMILGFIIALFCCC